MKNPLLQKILPHLIAIIVFLVISVLFCKPVLDGNVLNQHDNIGMVGAITVNEQEEVNFPYLKFKNKSQEIIDTKRSLSFCCTLMSLSFLERFSFEELDKSKDWYDTSLSKKSIDLGLKNIILRNVTVLHSPHGSRPWKQLKYRNPVKYYLNKLVKGRDKI